MALGGSEGGPVEDRFVEPSGGWVDLRGGGGQSESGHALAVFHQEREGREAGLHGQDGDRSRGEAAGDPSLDASPEGVESILHFHKGEEVGAVQENGGDQGGSQPMTEVWGEAHAWGGEAFYRIEGALSQGESVGEVGVCGQGRGEPITKPPDLILGGKVQIIESDARGRGGGAFLGSAPVDELSLGDREGKAFWDRNAAEGAVVTLKELNVPPVGGGRHCDHEIINVGENQSPGDGGVERRNINNKQEGGDRGALGGTHGDR